MASFEDKFMQMTGKKRPLVKWALIAAMLIISFGIGSKFGREQEVQKSDTTHQHETDTSAVQKWTCSMHPQIIMDKPGKCPICGMELIPLTVDTASETAQNQLTVSEETIKLLDIETSVVERRLVSAEIRMVGKIDYDETRVKDITAWVPGRIDRLYVDYTGINVRKGDHLVYLYSPQLISAQAELLQAVKAAASLSTGASEMISKSTIATLEAVREKLRLLGLSAEQIAEIEKQGQTQNHITIYSPIGGIVIEKSATEGMYVETGMNIYTVADLSRLWVKLDAYESDLVWIRYGQEVQFETEAYPGEIFKGKISFIDPIINPMTRTVKLRVNVDNTDGRLKPNMFVRAIVRSQVAQSEMVMAPEMAGKWICPMHPDVIKDSAGACDICQMPLVTTESLGYVKAGEIEQMPLVIPASAVLITGKRAVIYVKLPDTEKPTFELREIVLGPRAGDYYIVKSGIEQGQTVVTNGSFKIDSALQIQGKPSMMSPEGSLIPTGHEHAPEAKSETVPAKAAEQTLCPIMGNPINKELFTVYKGKKVYFCCPACKPVFEADPEKYLSKLPQFQNIK